MKGRGHVVLKLLWTQPVLWLCLALGCLVSPWVSFGVAPEPVSGAASMLQIWYIEADREKIFISVQHFCCGKRKEDHIAYVWTLRLNEQELFPPC